MSHPYADLPASAFWTKATSESNRAAFPGLYTPEINISRETRVATAGSCFAQHITRYLRAAGCKVLDAEPTPAPMTEAIATKFGYGIYSGRYGNIYTARQLCELLGDAASDQTDERFVWEKEGQFYDAFRPTIEPEGHAAIADVLKHRRHHLDQVAKMLRRTELFVFTLGLTEAWIDRASGRTFPVCPGVVAGQFDEASHVFHNFSHAETLADLHAAFALLRTFNPDIKMLLTVSPVPLTATASGDHVLSATTYSKSVLRGAVGEFVGQCDATSYFPSYEIIMSPASGGPWFAPDMRQVTQAGVEKVMSIFLSAHGLLDNVPQPSDTTIHHADEPADELVCEEILLQAFAK